MRVAKEPFYDVKILIRYTWRNHLDQEIEHCLDFLGLHHFTNYLFSNRDIAEAIRYHRINPGMQRTDRYKNVRLSILYHDPGGITEVNFEDVYGMADYLKKQPALSKWFGLFKK